MLDEQYFSDTKFHPYLTKTFILVRANRGEAIGDSLLKQYVIGATPTVLFAKADGTEIDRIVGYSAPPEKFEEKITQTLNSPETMLALTEAFTKDPGNAELILKIAQKYERGYNTAQAAVYYEKLLAVPEKAKTMTVPFRSGATLINVSAYEYVRYSTGRSDPAKLSAFIEEFPNSPLKETAINTLASLIFNPRTKDEALLKTGEALLDKYPNSLALVNAYVRYCVSTKSNVDRGVSVANRYYKTGTDKNDVTFLPNYADLLLLKGDEKTAKNVFGDNFVKANQSNAASLNRYATYWTTKEKNLDSALKAAKKVTELDNRAPSWHTQALVYMKMGKLQDALKCEETAVKLDSTYTRAKTQIEIIKAEMAKKKG